MKYLQTPRLLSGLLPLALLAACEAGSVDPAALPDVERRNESGALLPVYTMEFDHPPTEEEIEARLAEAQLTAPIDVSDGAHFGLFDGLDPVENPPFPFLPSPGQKQVRIAASTRDATGAGTDGEDDVVFIGRWRVGPDQSYSEIFALDNPEADDLERGTTSVFFYFLNLNQYAPGATSDQFIDGRIGNGTPDNWSCNSISVRDLNASGVSRTQSLPFATTVVSLLPGLPGLSPAMAGNNTAFLSY